MKICFTDSYYRTERGRGFDFVRGEAYGFCEDTGPELRLHFIRRLKKASFLSQVFSRNYFLKGLIIPKVGVMSYALGFEGKKFDLGKEASIRWVDMVHVENTKRSRSSVMETTGVVVIDEKNFVVVKNPETVRITKPQRKHPEVNPEHYFIPKALILDNKKDVRLETSDYDGEGQVSVVRFIKGGIEYEGVGVIFDRGDETRVAFSAINNEVVDFLDINKSEVVEIKKISGSEVVTFC